MTTPARRPGSDSGRSTSRKRKGREAPRLEAASCTRGLVDCSTS
jgi:hypothetical protein